MCNHFPHGNEHVMTCLARLFFASFTMRRIMRTKPPPHSSGGRTLLGPSSSATSHSLPLLACWRSGGPLSTRWRKSRKTFTSGLSRRRPPIRLTTTRTKSDNSISGNRMPIQMMMMSFICSCRNKNQPNRATLTKPCPSRSDKLKPVLTQVPTTNRVARFCSADHQKMASKKKHWAGV